MIIAVSKTIFHNMLSIIEMKQLGNQYITVYATILISHLVPFQAKGLII